MKLFSRQILRPFFLVLFPLFLAACGSDDTGNNSSAVYGSHSVVLVQSTPKSWGANGYGQLGNDSNNDSSNPVAVTFTGSFSSVSIGGAHNVALASDGTVWTWGLNASGQLGNDSLNTEFKPIQVPSLSGIKAVAAGVDHSLAIAADDTVWAWGLNSSGQLGNNDANLAPQSSPVQVLTAGGVTPLSGVTAIAAGGAFSLALKSDGTVWAWGNNNNGQLGNADDTVTTSSVAVQVMTTGGTPLTGITAIAAGGSHALALDGSGTMYAWGYNIFGQLGDGEITSSFIAVPVVRAGITGTVTSISAGLDHSLAIIDGAVYSWGYNFYGQLGNGAALLSYDANTELQSVVDQNNIPLSNITTIIATGHHCIAVDTSGSIWTWGNDTYGQLGDGTTQSRSKAQKVISGV